jgi:ribosome-binding protein aMBF1 (putative translation factor)
MPKARTDRDKARSAIFKAAKALGISRAALARKAGLNPSVLYSAEAGRITLGAERLRRLRDAGARL